MLSNLLTSALELAQYLPVMGVYWQIPEVAVECTWDQRTRQDVTEPQLLNCFSAFRPLPSAQEGMAIAGVIVHPSFIQSATRQLQRAVAQICCPCAAV